MKNKYALKHDNTIYYIGTIMDCPVELQEGVLIDVDFEEQKYSFYADDEGYSHPISECEGWEIVEVEPY